ncbi:MAG: TMAO reductase system periplasmic protein TorT [Gammaproteobacteria bacterium]|nr:TMAO reductase system periplasmic protein TorT [Gammaproteobacteria bacterium]MCP5136646.1 TMAO reductase system periplasmic protein TorT [Gammaproteobacteria bacterium]
MSDRDVSWALRAGVGLAMALLIGAASFAAVPNWFPADVDLWEPPFNNARIRHPAQYVPLEKAERRWRVCVSIPHLKDAYWLAVNYGLIDEAKRLGVGVRLFSAGGYGELKTQRNQVAQCLSDGYDALILSAISADGLNDLVAQWAVAGKPVIDLINGINSPRISARAAATYWDMGNLAGKWIKARQPESGEPTRIAWFPGPARAAWSAEGDQGMRDALAGSDVEIVAVRWGDTGKTAQAALIEEVLDKDSTIEYIVGTTVTAEAAIEILRDRGLDQTIQVIAYYYGPGVHRAIQRGRVAAAPTDKQAISARISLDQAIRILERRDFMAHVGPRPQMIDRAALRDFDFLTSVAPRGFRAIFSVND